MDPGLLFVVARVNAAGDPLECTLSPSVRSAGARMKEVHWVPSSPSTTTHADDKRRAVGLDSRKGMPLGVAKGTRQARTEAWAVLVAALLLHAVTLGERETDLARPSSVVVYPLVWWAGTLWILLTFGAGEALSAVPQACFAEGQRAAMVPITLQMSSIFCRFASQVLQSAVFV